MDFNFFNWIRDGVKKSVLLGVSDAVDEIGVPDGDKRLPGTHSVDCCG